MKASSATRMTVSSSDNVTSCGERKTTKKKPSKGRLVNEVILVVANAAQLYHSCQNLEVLVQFITFGYFWYNIRFSVHFSFICSFLIRISVQVVDHRKFSSCFGKYLTCSSKRTITRLR